MSLLDDFVYISPLAPVISLDALLALPNSIHQRPFDIAAPDISVEERLDRSIMLAALDRFLETLPPSDRELVHQHYWDDVSQAALARTNGVSAAAISKRMTKIYAKGKRALALHSDFKL
jgi:RNA polymerase sigma factor (sigma-70 family)